MGTDLYNAHFGFSERPFTLLPDPGLVFWSDVHKRAFTVLEYGLISRAPLTVVTGEVGTGKTTLVQLLIRQIEAETTVALISNAQGGRGDLLRWILNAFDIDAGPGLDYVALFQKFQDFVIDEYSANRHVVVIIDEAQNLSGDTLEELRMLTNINSNKDELLQLILVGQPELRAMISRPELRQFAQRVTAAYHLNPLDKATTDAYIRHRLTAVGGYGDEFSDEAIDLIFQHSQGIPRVVNKICDIALVYAASDGRDRVSLDLIEELIADGVILTTGSSVFLLESRMRVNDGAME